MSIDNDTDAIVRAYSTGDGDYSNSFCDLAKGGYRNHQRIMRMTLAAMAALKLNLRLAREHYGQAGGVQFIINAESAAGVIDTPLAAERARLIPNEFQ